MRPIRATIRNIFHRPKTHRHIRTTSEDIRLYPCGHAFATTYSLYIDDTPIIHATASATICGDCILKQILNCGLCGNFILPGDGVYICIDDPRLFGWIHKPHVGLIRSEAENTRQVVCCLRGNCDALTFCGIWDGTQVLNPFNDENHFSVTKSRSTRS